MEVAQLCEFLIGGSEDVPMIPGVDLNLMAAGQVCM